MANVILWDDKYNVGNELIDSAHKQLFSILRHIWNKENLDDKKKEWVCAETIKFLKSYTLRHFAQEEAFMIKLGYEGYESHKRAHDNLREIALPALEKELVESNYSDEAVEHLVAIMSGWLTGHIIIEDQAITGKHVVGKSTHVNELGLDSNGSTDDDLAEALEILNDEYSRFMKEFFGVAMNLEKECYNYGKIENSKTIRIEYKIAENFKTVTFVTQNSLILHMASKILGMKINKLDKTSLLAYSQMLITCGKAAVSTFSGRNDIEFVKIYSYSLEDDFLKNNSCCMSWNSHMGKAAIVIK